MRFNRLSIELLNIRTWQESKTIIIMKMHEEKKLIIMVGHMAVHEGRSEVRREPSVDEM